MSDAIIGYGSVFQTGDGGNPEAFTAHAEVKTITPPSFSRDSVDVTHMASPDGFREFIMALTDAGEVAIEMNYKKTSLSGLVAEFNTRTLKNRKIVFPDNSVWAFSAGITGLEMEDPVDESIAVTATFKISGKPTFTEG